MTVTPTLGAMLRDPLLPETLLPPDWPARQARELCGRGYRAVLPTSEQWLDRHGESVAGVRYRAWQPPSCHCRPPSWCVRLANKGGRHESI